MLSLSLRHFLRQALKIHFGEHRHFFFRHHLAATGAARRAGTDPEGGAPEGPVRSRHHHLRTNVLLVLVVRPGKFAEPASWPIVRVCSCEGPRRMETGE